MPRNQFGFVGIRNNVSGFVNESLPNITGKLNIPVYGPWVETVEGAFSKDTIRHIIDDGNNSIFDSLLLNFNASLSSSTYQNNAPVQQKAVQMYLEFYLN